MRKYRICCSVQVLDYNVDSRGKLSKHFQLFIISMDWQKFVIAADKYWMPEKKIALMEIKDCQKHKIQLQSFPYWVFQKITMLLVHLPHHYMCNLHYITNICTPSAEANRNMSHIPAQNQKIGLTYFDEYYKRLSKFKKLK